MMKSLKLMGELMSSNNKKPVKPKKTSEEKVLSAMFWLFPLTAAYGAVRFVVNGLFGKLMGKAIVPALKIPQDDPQTLAATNASKIFEHQNNLLTYATQVPTYDGASLDTLEIQNPEEAKKPTKQQTFVINFMDRFDNYAVKRKQFAKQALELPANQICFDYRGVNKSSKAPRSYKDLVTDGITQVNRLLDLGVAPKNIVLNGDDLGAAIATFVAQHFHERNINIRVFNSRGFATLTKDVVGRIGVKLKNPDVDFNNKKLKVFAADEKHPTPATGLARFVKTLAAPFVKLGLSLTRWEMYPAGAYYNLPERSKEFITVKPSKQERKYPDADTRPQADRNTSFYRKVGDLTVEHTGSVYKKIKFLKTRSNDQKVLFKEEAKRRKMAVNIDRLATQNGIDGHRVNLEQLTNRNGNSALDVLKFFIKPEPLDLAKSYLNKLKAECDLFRRNPDSIGSNIRIHDLYSDFNGIDSINNMKDLLQKYNWIETRLSIFEDFHSLRKTSDSQYEDKFMQKCKPLMLFLNKLLTPYNAANKKRETEQLRDRSFYTQSRGTTSNTDYFSF